MNRLYEDRPRQPQTNGVATKEEFKWHYVWMAFTDWQVGVKLDYQELHDICANHLFRLSFTVLVTGVL